MRPERRSIFDHWDNVISDERVPSGQVGVGFFYSVVIRTAIRKQVSVREWGVPPFLICRDHGLRSLVGWTAWVRGHLQILAWPDCMIVDSS